MAEHSIVLGEHFDGFLRRLIESGRFESVSEAVRAGLRMLEDHESKAAALREALIEGEESGEDQPLDIDSVILGARSRAGLDA